MNENIMKKKCLTSLNDVSEWFIFPFPVIAFDTETTSLDYRKAELLGISFCSGNFSCYIDLYENKERDAIIQFIKNLFEKYFNVIIGHNITYDLKILSNYNIYPSEECKWFDTQTAAHLLDENAPKSLKFLSNYYLNKPLTEYDKIKRFHPNSKEFREYGRQDAVATYGLFSMFLPKLKLEGLYSLFKDIEMEFLKVKMDMEMNGILIDQEKLSSLQSELQVLISNLLKEMCETANVGYMIQETMPGFDDEFLPGVNFNSSQQLIKLLEKLGVELTETTENGNYSVGEPVLKKIKNKHPFIPKLLEYKKAQKLWSSFVSTFSKFIDDDGRIRSNFNNTVAVTGRVTSSEPNLLQLPRQEDDIRIPFEFRSCFVAPEGKKIVAADYSGQELCWLGEVTQDPGLIDDLSNGKDIHLTVARNMFDLPIKDKALFKSHPEYNEVKEKYYTQRHRAKNGVVFPVIYGKTEYGISKEFDISEKEASKWIDAFFSLYPCVKKRISKCHSKIDKHSEVVDWFGRKRRFNIDTYKDKYSAYRMGFNFLIQSPSASQMKIASTNIKNDFDYWESEWAARILLIVYDELVFEVNEDSVEITCEVVKNEMENAVITVVPFTVEIGVGNNYAEAK